jgi:hypothetical protein
MSQKISFQNFEVKTLFFLEQLNKRLKLIKDYERIKKSYDSLFSSNSAYDHLLEKAKITNQDPTLAISLLPLTNPDTFNSSIFISANACPAIFHLKQASGNINNLGLSLKREDISQEKEFCLLFDELGNSSLIVYLENRDIEIYSFFDFENVLFLNLPLVLYGIINSKNFVKEKLFLEEIAKKNPVSTLANLYSFLREKSEALPLLSQALLKFNRKILATNRQFGKNVLFQEAFFQTSKEFLVESQANGIPYSLIREKEKIIFKLNFRSKYMAKRYFSQYGEAFPLYILLEGAETKAYFISHQAFVTKITKGFLKQKPSLALDGGNLLTLEEKMAEPLHKPIQSLSENIKLVLATFDIQIEQILASGVELEQEKQLAKILRRVEACKKTSAELVRFLEEIYKKEILLGLL